MTLASMGRDILLMALLAGAPSALPAQTKGPEVRLIDEAGLRSLIDERHGRGLILNVWATWCAPCVEEFPGLVKLDSAYRSAGLDVVTISIDFEDEIEGKVKPFLRRVRATMPSYVNAFPTPGDLITALHPSWSGAIPATFVYDRQGVPVTHVIGHQSYRQFSELAQRALAKRR